MPFNSAYHNHRAITCHVSQFIVLLVSNSYGNMVEADITNKAHSYEEAGF